MKQFCWYELPVSRRRTTWSPWCCGSEKPRKKETPGTAGGWPLCVAPGSPAGVARSVVPIFSWTADILTSWPLRPTCVPICSLFCISLLEDPTHLEIPALRTCLPEPRIWKARISYLCICFSSGLLLPPLPQVHTHHRSPRGLLHRVHEQWFLLCIWHCPRHCHLCNGLTIAVLD